MHTGETARFAVRRNQPGPLPVRVTPRPPIYYHFWKIFDAR